MYGSLREFSELGDEYEDLNKGIVSCDDFYVHTLRSQTHDCLQKQKIPILKSFLSVLNWHSIIQIKAFTTSIGTAIVLV